MNLPNKITLARLFATPIALLTFYIDFPLHITVALCIFILAVLTDPLDGYLARKFKMVTKLGSFLDPLSDKFIVNGFLITLTITGNIYPLWLLLIMLGRDAIISAFRNFGASQNIFMRATILGKLKVLLQIFSIISGLITIAIQKGEMISLNSYQTYFAQTAYILLITALVISIWGMAVMGFENWKFVMKKFHENE